MRGSTRPDFLLHHPPILTAVLHHKSWRVQPWAPRPRSATLLPKGTRSAAVSDHRRDTSMRACCMRAVHAGGAASRYHLTTPYNTHDPQPPTTDLSNRLAHALRTPHLAPLTSLSARYEDPDCAIDWHRCGKFTFFCVAYVVSWGNQTAKQTTFYSSVSTSAPIDQPITHQSNTHHPSITHDTPSALPPPSSPTTPS